MFILVILFFGIIGFWDMVPLIKNKRFKELALYIPVFLAAFLMMLLLSLSMEFPNPADKVGGLWTGLTGLE